MNAFQGCLFIIIQRFLCRMLYLLLLLIRNDFINSIPNHDFQERRMVLPGSLTREMLLLEENSRERFIEECIVKKQCTEADIVGKNAKFQFKDPHTASKDKEHLWQVTLCSISEDKRSCPVDGGWSGWSEWSLCGAICGNYGTRTRERDCNNPIPRMGGYDCPGSSIDEQICISYDCEPGEIGGKPVPKTLTPVLDLLFKYNSEIPLLKHCLTNSCSQDYVKSFLQGKELDLYWTSLHCVKYSVGCPESPEWQEWSEWSRCSASCGIGFRTRVRKCIVSSMLMKRESCDGAPFKKKPCSNAKECLPKPANPITGYLSEWSKWSDCLAECGQYGWQQSIRIRMGRLNEVATIPDSQLVRQRPCFQSCHGNSTWLSWGEWSRCSAVCGYGKQLRLRICSVVGSRTDHCEGEEVSSRQCHLQGAECLQASIELGKSKLLGEISGPSNSPPKDVASVVIATGHPHNVSEDTPVVKYTKWSQWSECTRACSGGERYRHRWCKKQMVDTGRHLHKLPCRGEVIHQQFCNPHLCPVPGGWGPWADWSACDAACGFGTQVRYRLCNTPPPQYGGSCIGDNEERVGCVMPSCPTFTGQWAKWSEWSECSQTCDYGYETRSRRCVKNPRIAALVEKALNHSAPIFCYGQDSEWKPCITKVCPVNGGWSEWGEWTFCSSSCGLGVRTRERTCTNPSPVGEGLLCSGDAWEIDHCIKHPCDILESLPLFFGDSFDLFGPMNVSSRFLVIYIQFKLFDNNAVLLHRFTKHCGFFRHCPEVLLALENGFPVLTVTYKSAKLYLTSKRDIEIGQWQDIYAVVVGTIRGFLRLNKRPDRYFRHFTGKHYEDINYDQWMYVGNTGAKDKGMKGYLRKLHINYKDYFSETEEVDIQKCNNIQQKLTEFEMQLVSIQDVKMPCGEDPKITYIEAMVRPEGPGTILSNTAEEKYTFMKLTLELGKFHFCVTTNLDEQCRESNKTIEFDEWYVIFVTLTARQAEFRINHHYGETIYFQGSYTCKSPVKLGAEVPNNGDGFIGDLALFSVNKLEANLKDEAYEMRDMMPSNTASLAEKFTTHKLSNGTDYRIFCSKNITGYYDSRVRFIFPDKFIKPSEDLEIHHYDNGSELIFVSVTYPNAENMTGIYGCFADNGAPVKKLMHAFGIYFSVKRKKPPGHLGLSLLVGAGALVIVLLIWLAFVVYYWPVPAPIK